MKQKPSASSECETSSRSRGYWRTNLWVVGSLLAIWLTVGYGLSIFWIERFNSISLGKLGLGFWFAQQGSILVFVLLVWSYALLMDRVDRRMGRGKD
jgi:putative solute:sodium symporter small subunit